MAFLQLWPPKPQTSLVCLASSANSPKTLILRFINFPKHTQKLIHILAIPRRTAPRSACVHHIYFTDPGWWLEHSESRTGWRRGCESLPFCCHSLGFGILNHVQNLDIQYTVGLASGVPVTFISVGQNNTDGLSGFLDLINFLLGEDAPPQVLTTSYGMNNID